MNFKHVMPDSGTRGTPYARVEMEHRAVWVRYWADRSLMVGVRQSRSLRPASFAWLLLLVSTIGPIFSDNTAIVAVERH
jgi:hypothetical protein